MRIVLGLALALQLAVLAPATAEAQSNEEMKKQEPRLNAIPGTAGQGELKLTSSAAVTYQEYFAHACPLVLLVEEAGWATHAAFGEPGSCPPNEGAIQQATIRGALNACNTYAANRPCSVIAIGRKMVWEGKITYLPGPYIPYGMNQRAVVLRKQVSPDELTTAYETAVGVMSFYGEGHSGDVTFQRHDELGVCSGSLHASSPDALPVALSCTKVGTITGSLAIKGDDRTGTGTATGTDGRNYTLTVLPKADFMENGTAIYETPPDPDMPMTNNQLSEVSQ
jgi:hypothetical protein